MILEELLKSQKSIFNGFKDENKEVYDVVIFGSLVRGKEANRDIDIAIILSEKKSLTFKLELAQKLRNALKFKDYIFDVKTIDFEDLLDNAFLARQGILIEGFSVIKNKFLCEISGFKSFCLFVYDMKNISASKKRIFSYALRGRYNSKGMMRLKNIEQLGRGVLKVPIQHSEEIKDLLDSYNIKYKTQYCIMPFF